MITLRKIRRLVSMVMIITPLIAFLIWGLWAVVTFGEPWLMWSIFGILSVAVGLFLSM